MNSTLCLLDHTLSFPAPHTALSEPNGLLAIGGDLSPARLKRAYQQGIFPWFSEQEPILWWSPDPRAVLYIAQLHISRSMHKFLRHTTYRVTLNQQFEQVITACAKRGTETWMTADIQQAYLPL